ncbi:PP2C family protein-serine/threonine phosphatase [Nonomuraea fastidiosa]|jgi:serine phosphatase RsbU (regulator of sigma subunit)|uniref:PP2C family protein-serine/threonine phosphatase n=1 Tax=Nonomuraea TaxID=83681 RepID=UPI00341257FE
MIAVITAADLLSPSRIHFGALLVAAPAISASFAGAGFTAVIGLLALAGEAFIALQSGTLGTDSIKAELAAIAVVSVFVVLFCHLRNRERRVLAQVRSVAEAAQLALLRPLPGALGPLRLASVYLAAAAEARIGGDLYGAVRTARATRLLIGDARGKGLPAIADAAALVGAFREAARRDLSLAELVADLEDSAEFTPYRFAEESPAEEESFVTAAVLEFPDDEPVLSVVSCGHPPPLLIHHGEVILLPCDPPAPPLGLGDLSSQRLCVCSFRFEPGDLLLLHTDGVTEARDASGVFYPLQERVAAWTQETPEGLLKRLCDDLLDYTGGRLDDDAAMVAVHRLPTGKAAASETDQHFSHL